jgi:uncharacterized protein DUF1206
VSIVRKAEGKTKAKSVVVTLLHFLARFGSFCVGTVYVLIGIWALLALLRWAEPAADEARILNRFMSFPMGNVLIAGLAAGIFGYAVWAVYEAVRDPYDFGSRWVGVLERAGLAMGALVYGSLAFTALMALRGHGGHGEESQRLLAARILEWPAGQWLIGAMGLALVASGLFQIKYVSEGGHRRRLRMDSAPPFLRTAAHVLAWSGFIARCVILLVLGGFLLKSAWSSDPGAIGDTDTAFDFLGLGGGTLGDSVFTLIALGTIGYGVFLYINSVFFRFQED